MAIEGDRIYLRALERGDVERMHGWINDAEVNRNLVFNFPFSFDMEMAWYEGKQQPNDKELILGIVDRGSGKHIGNIGLHAIDWVNSAAEVGILIGDKDYWSKGLGTDALLTIMGYAFNSMNLNRLYLKVYGFNKRAVRAYEKCGFVLEGTLREDVYRDGKYHDTLIMGVLKREYDCKGR